MKICGISDMHGNLGFNVPQCDLLLICGDIVPLRMQFYTKPSMEWMKNTFLEWCNQQPCGKVIMVGGNHDWALERHPKVMERMCEGTKATYLNCSFAEYEGLTIYGTPLCHQFGNWAFMPTDEEQDKTYNKALSENKNVDIIIAHDAPYGVSDVLLQPPYKTGEHIGNEPLYRLIDAAKPKVAFHGHLHSTNHEKEMLGGTEVYNVSLLDETYSMVYKPLIIEF